MDNLVATGDPTKEFFIEMLTRDILLSDAILDLIDNSVDGARRQKEDGNFKGLFIKLSLSENEFVIEDNCGGIPIEVAKHYAFRFGRPKESDHGSPYSIGRFGIGMKRALFKIGKTFKIFSKNGADSYIINDTVQSWIEQPNWDFHIELLDIVTGSDGTIITITDLNEEIKTNFVGTQVINDLIDLLSATFYSVLEKGLKISINNIELSPDFVEIYDNEIVTPKVDNFEVSGVTGKIITGISDPDPTSAGWYIFCNDRLVLAADKSKLTGWGGSEDPTGHGFSYHNDFAMFRGLLFLDASDPFKLPLTTTKRGVDGDSAIFKSIKLRMVTAMKVVAPFIRKIKDADMIEELKVDILFNEKKDVQTQNYTVNKPFEVKKKIEKTTVRIQYDIEHKQFNDVKSNLGVSTNKDVGLKTFEYYFKMEC